MIWASTACTLEKETPTSSPLYTATMARQRWTSGMTLIAIKSMGQMGLHSIPTLKRFVWSSYLTYNYKHLSRMTLSGFLMISCVELYPWYSRRVWNRRVCLGWDSFLGKTSLCLKRNILGKLDVLRFMSFIFKYYFLVLLLAFLFNLKDIKQSIKFCTDRVAYGKPVIRGWKY